MKKLIPAIIAVIISSCATPLEFQLSQPGEEQVEFQQRIVYSLPRTIVRVKLSVEKETYIPGPYYQFAERFLGLEDYISNYGFQYKITGVELESFEEPDPAKFYSVNIREGNFNWEQYLSVSEKGFIMDPISGSAYNLDLYNSEPAIEGSLFKDLATNFNLTEVKDTLYKTIITDSSLVRLPVVTTAREVRTLEQKAEEAASNLFTIRENKFFLISNTEGDYPDGKALEVMVKEMGDMEKAYLELFTGKLIRQKYEKYYLYIPEQSTDKQVVELGGFSSLSGFSGTGEGLPLRLEISPLNNYHNLESIKDFNSKGEPITNTLYYRIPDRAKFRILLSNDCLYEGYMNVYQLGALINIPVSEK